MNMEGGKVVTFADDTVLLFEGDDWNDAFYKSQIGFDRVTGWLNRNLLTLNISKTNYLCYSINDSGSPRGIFQVIYHTCGRTSQTYLGGHVRADGVCGCAFIERCRSTRYLGVIVDEHLNWKEQIAQLTARVRKLIYVFRELRKVLNDKCIRMVYHALCASIINYGILSWGGAAITVLNPVYKAQKFIIKVMNGFRLTYPTVELFEGANLLSVRQAYIHRVIMRIVVAVNRQDRSTRQIGELIISHARTTFFQRFNMVLGPRVLNRVRRRITQGRITSIKAIFEFLVALKVEESEKLLNDVLI
jgi:uncharacterized membrane protein